MHEAAAGRVEPLAYGVAFLSDDLPRVLDQNFLWAQDAQRLAAAQLIADADRLQGAARLTHRRIVVDHEPLWRELTAAFDAAGWRRETEVVMTCHAEPDREVDTARVHGDLTHEQLSPAVAEYYGSESWGGDAETRRQLLEHGRRMGRAAGEEQRFGVLEDDRVVAYCKLWHHAGTAQIEDVVVLPGHRGRGHGRAVVTAALRAARVLRVELLFIVADDEDWPKELYARLGFRPVGRMRIFDRLSTSSG